MVVTQNERRYMAGALAVDGTTTCIRGTTEAAGSVATQLERLGAAVSKLNVAIRALEDRLSPVLREVVVPGQEAAASPSHCELSKAVELQVGYLDNMAEYVETLARRIDL